MKKMVKLIKKIMLATTIIIATCIGLTSCQSNNSSISEKNNSETKSSFSSSSSSKNTQASSNSVSTSKIRSTIETTAKYIRKNYTDRHLAETSPYSYKITSQKYKGYKTEVYAFANSEVYSNPNDSFQIKVNVDLSGCYMSVIMDFSVSDLERGEGLEGAYVQVLDIEPETLFSSNLNNHTALAITDEISLNFNSSSTISFGLTYGFENSKIDIPTAKYNGAMMIDFGLKYTSSLLSTIGCNIKDFGFINY